MLMQNGWLGKALLLPANVAGEAPPETPSPAPSSLTGACHSEPHLALQHLRVQQEGRHRRTL